MLKKSKEIVIAYKKFEVHQFRTSTKDTTISDNFPKNKVEWYHQFFSRNKLTKKLSERCRNVERDISDFYARLKAKKYIPIDVLDSKSKEILGHLEKLGEMHEKYVELNKTSFPVKSSLIL